MRYQRLIYAWVGALLSLSAHSQAVAQTAWHASEARSEWSVTDARTAWHAAEAKSALKWEMSYLALSAIDTAQTIECLQRGECEEANPLFGKHPKPAQLIATKLAFGAVHFALFNHINSRNSRAAMRFAQGSVIVQGGVVLLNARFTIR